MTKISRRKGSKVRIETLSEEEAQKLYESWGGKGEFREIFEQFNRDNQFISSRIQELTDQYPDQWIAVYNGKVIGYDKNRHRLFSRLRRKGTDTSHVAMEFLPMKRRPHILLSEAA